MHRCGHRTRYVGGTYPVTVRDRRQALHMGSQQFREDLGFGLAQLREFGRRVGDRAVVLAQLDAGGDRLK